MSQSYHTPNEEPCPSCGVLLEVGGEPFLATVRCPQCLQEVRVRHASGDYRLLEVLGQGGSGRVFRARKNGNDTDVALKVLEKESGNYEENLLLLRNEAACGRSVEHPHVVKILGLEEDEEGARLEMELMDGGSLHDLIVSGERVSEERLLWMGLEILKALEAIHASGLVHRDLKPANILFNAEGVSKLGDFGLARGREAQSLIQTHLLATPDYVAPEILEGSSGDLRSEFYSLGGCLYHAMAGRPPYETEGLELSDLRMIKVKPVRPDHSVIKNQQTRELIERMLAPDPKHRFQTCEDVERQFLIALKFLRSSGGVWRSANRKNRGRLRNPRAQGIFDFLFGWMNRNQT